jgi:Tol biopolymer transport system component/DNA-binding winged helix-turn-helix (wHTH) protein
VQPADDTKLVRFGPFVVNFERRVLRKHGVRVKLQAQPFQILEALLERPGTTVTREELRRRLWPDNTFVDFDHGLNAAVARLRQALGDSPEQPRYVETRAKLGYRFTARVEDTVECKGQTPAGPALIPKRRTGVWIAPAVVLATTGVGAFLFVSTPTLPPTVRPVPLTAFRGFEANPALSPDGNHVAFKWNGDKQDNFDIYVIPIASGTPVRLTTDPEEDCSPAWSPDGRTIAFLRRRPGDYSELKLVPATGGPEHKLADTREITWFQPRKPSSLAWSPDGHWIAASHREPDERADGIYLFSLTGEKRRLTAPPPGFRSDNMPAFSPDGRALAFCRLPGGFGSEIYVLPLDGDLRPSGEARRLTDNKRWSAQPVWAGDGRRILYVFGDDASKGREIGIINVAYPETPRQTIPLSDEISEIAFGRHLVYSRQFEDTNIWRAELPGRKSAPATAEPFISSTRPDQTPKYSPDGKKIAFMSSRSGSREIWVSNADGSNPVRMTAFGGPLVGGPTWSPDGKRIAFHGRPEGGPDVFVIPAAGGSAKPLATNSWVPSYSGDGQTMYFSSRRSGGVQIWKMPAHGGAAVQLTASDGAQLPHESPDGKIIYYLRQDRSEIWSVPAQGGKEVRVTGPTQRYPAGLAVTPEGIYYSAPPHAGEERFIRFLNLSTGENTPVVVAKRPFHAGMSVSPDGRYMLFDQYDESGSDLMMVENFDNHLGYGWPRKLANAR